MVDLANAGDRKQQSQSQGWAWIAVVLLALFGIGSYFWFNASQNEATISKDPGSLLNGLFGPLLVLGIVLVTIIIGARVMRTSTSNDLRDKDREQNFQLSVAMWAVFALSAVSFLTTLDGLYEFLRPKNELGSQTISLFLSFGTTIGIQGLMLVMALLLGKRIMSLKPLSVEKSRQLYSIGPTPYTSAETPMEVLRGLPKSISFAAFAIGCLLLLLTYLLYNYGLDTRRLGLGQTFRIESGLSIFTVCLGIGAIFFLYKTGALGQGWQTMTLVFLAFVYFGTLSISSLFSFDAYYRRMQTDENIELNREATVTQRTGEIIANAADLLDEEIALQQSNLRTGRAFNETKDGLSSLVAVAAQNRVALDEALKETRNRAKERLEQARTAQNLEIARNMTLSGDIASAQGRLPQIETEIVSITAEITPIEDRLKVAREDRRKKIAEKTTAEILREKERAGVDGAKKGIGPKFRQFDGQVKSLEAFLKGLETRISSDEAELNDKQNKIADLSKEKSGLDVELTGLKAQLPSKQVAKPGDPPSKNDKNLDSAANNLEKSIKALDVLEGADPRQVSVTLSNFTREFDRETYDRYLVECNTLVSTLQGVNSNDATINGFICQPPQLRSNADKIFKLGEAKVAFEKACKDSVSGLEFKDALKKTRKCLQTTTLTNAKFGSLNNDLTQLQTQYLTTGYDLRRSINNFRANEQFAVGAAGGAVFIDLLILVVGIIIAMLKDSRLYSSTKNITAEQVEKDLVAMASTHDEHRDPHAAILRFLNYMQPAPSADDEYTMTLDLNHVAPDDKALANSLIGVARPFLKPKNKQSEPDTSIYQFHQTFVMSLNDLAAKGAINGKPRSSANTRTGPISPSYGHPGYVPAGYVRPTHAPNVHDSAATQSGYPNFGPLEGGLTSPNYPDADKTSGIGTKSENVQPATNPDVSNIGPKRD